MVAEGGFGEGGEVLVGVDEELELSAVVGG